VFLLLFLLAFEACAQSVAVPKEWQKLNTVEMLQVLEASKQPFLVRRLTLSMIDQKFASLTTLAQEELLWTTEKRFAGAQKRSPTLFVIWDSDRPDCCGEVFLEGDSYRLLRAGSLFLAVAFRSGGDTGYARVYASLDEKSQVRVNIVPETFRVAHIDPKLQVQSPLDPAKLGSKFTSRAGWRATLVAGLGSLQTQQVRARSDTTASGSFRGGFDIMNSMSGGTARGSYAGSYSGTTSQTTTVTAPDYEARARAQAQAEAIRNSANGKSAQVVAGALRATTLLPGQSISGLVYFKRDKKVKHSILVIPVGSVQFEFGTTWK
jgi:hypothetical protein